MILSVHDGLKSSKIEEDRYSATVSLDQKFCWILFSSVLCRNLAVPSSLLSSLTALLSMHLLDVLLGQFLVTFSPPTWPYPAVSEPWWLLSIQ